MGVNSAIHKQMRVPIAVLAALFSVSIVQVVYFDPRLPDIVVSHTGPNGPDGWMSKESYLAIMLGMEIALMALIVVLPIVAGHRNNRVNIPNADYWLEPARRASTLRRLGKQLLWLAVVMQAGNVLIWQFTLEENLGVAHLVPVSLIVLVGLTVAAGAVWTWRFGRNFSLPP